MHDELIRIRKLKAIKSRLLRSHEIARLRVFDSAVTSGAKDNRRNLGVLRDFEKTPTLFDLSRIQTELEEELGVSISLAVTGMIQPDWESEFITRLSIFERR